MGQIDAALKPFVKQRPPKLVYAALQTATAQILYMGTPPHAAVGETVAMLKSRGSSKGFANMANAVLRRVTEQGAQSVRLNKIGDVTALEGFEEGEWWAQDIAASLPVQLMGDVSGLRALDLCGAPGGKTMQLAAKGANVTVLDKSEGRLKRVHENLKRTRLTANSVCADALEWEPAKTNFDIVLLDAPCSATGTFRRHPDVLYNKTPKAVANLVRLQDKLFTKAASFVRPGGRLLYCTCSLQPQEGMPRVVKFLETMTDFRLIPTLEVSGLALPEDAFSDGGLRSLPYYLEDKGGMDGFFIAQLARKE